MITEEYMSELKRYIEFLSDKVERHPEVRKWRILLDASLRSYNAKQKLQLQDEQRR